MNKFFTFLRAINVGGHNVKMDQLRKIFETIGHTQVETFIASGNVIFETTESDRAKLVTEIEATLLETLGYEVATFLRTIADLRAVAAHQPFPQAELAHEGNVLFVAFTNGELGADARQKLDALTTEVDEFQIHGAEVYYLYRKQLAKSNFTSAKFERSLGTQATLRNINTVNRLLKKYDAN